MNFTKLLGKDTPIGQKVMAAILLTCSAVSLLTYLAFFAYEYVTFRQSLIGQLTAYGEIISANSTAALAFNDETSAQETLSALKSRPNIIAAALYDKEGNIFSRFPKNLPDTSLPKKPGKEGYQFDGAYLSGFQPVVQDDTRHGTLYLKSDMSAMTKRMELYSIIVMFLMAISFLLAYILSKILKKRIADPILALAKTAERISVGQDYSVRATKTGEDEVGQLTDAFNQMVTQIQKQSIEAQLFTKELAASNQELEQFAYIASHDLQEPLRMVTSFLSQLEKKYKDQLDDKAHQYIHFAVDGAVRMRRIILDLLEFSRVGKDVVTEPVDLNEILNEVVKLNQATIDEKRGQVVWHALPTIIAARTPLLQLFHNLVSNALKYQPDDSVPVVSIHSDETDHYWKFAVTDNGIGIESQYFDKIFLAFQRLHANDQYSGSGIGLAICKKIVEHFDGKIWIESEFGKGTIFHFTIRKKNLVA